MPDLLAGCGVQRKYIVVAVVMYITPLTTIGVISIDMFGSPRIPVWKIHAGFSWETLAGLIWSMF